MISTSRASKLQVGKTKPITLTIVKGTVMSCSLLFKRILSAGVFFLFLVTTAALGQDATGRIVGTVTDPAGAAILGAQVTVLNPATQISQVVNTNENGYYQVLSLPIGTYTITIEHSGFRKHIFEGQVLQINQSMKLDAKLEIGQQNEVVEVQEQAANVETVDQTIGVNVVGETIQRAPLNGRNVLDLAKLQPGVTETNGDTTAAGTYSIAGGRSDSVTFLLDGGLNNNLLDNSVVFNPNPDTIAEFRILESNYSAEYGRNGGGVISVVTKSGTNVWHGSGFEFLRNDALNANQFFNKNDPNNLLPRDVLKRNQFGGTFGGPITLPKLVNGKDRFFFFVGYQGQKLSSQQSTGTTTVFTPAQITGDFSGGGAPGNCPLADTGVADFLQANPFFQSDPAKAACGIIDPTKINPVAQNYINLGFLPTSPEGQANYHGSHTNNNNELTMKFDVVLSQKDKISTTLGGNRNPQLNPFDGATVLGFPDLVSYHNYFGNLAYSHVFTPNIVNELRLFAQRNNYVQDDPAIKLPNASDLGIGITPDNPSGPPIIAFDNGLTVGFSPAGPTNEINNTFGFVDTLSWVRGRHNLKLGTGVSAYQNNTVYDFYVNGQFDFSGDTVATDNSLADFLLGAPSDYFQYPAAPSNIRSKSFFGFAQDEWRVSKKLTLNLGLRYEYNTPKSDTKGRTFSIIPGQQSQVFTNAPVGMVFPGDPGAPSGVNFPDKNDWAPRFGFAWDPKGDGKTSLRGGIGVFYDVLKGEDNLQFNGQPPFFASAGLFFPTVGPGQASDVPFLSDPFGSAGSPNPFPSTPPPSNLDFAAAGFLPINSGGAVYLVDPHLRTPYTYQYNLSLQREIAPNTVLEITYVGSSSHGLTTLVDVNPFVLGTTDRVLNLQQGNSSCVDDDLNSSSGADPDAFCSYAGLPEFKNLTKASYNGLQTSLTKQIANTGFLGRTYFTLAYTYAHAIDNTSGFRNRNSEVPAYAPDLLRASSDQDIRHRITFSGGWDLPIEHMWNSGPKRLTQGWSLFPIVTWRTGFPFDFFARLPGRFDPGSEGPSGAGDAFDVYANVVGSTKTLDPRKSQDFGFGPGNYYVNPNSFSNAQCGDDNNPDPCTPSSTVFPSSAQVVADPSLATYGTLARNSLRGPGYVNFDLAFSKTTNLVGERVKLEFRAEFFNLFNHANFLSPGVVNEGDGVTFNAATGNNINSSQFGQITSTYDPRIIQLALRLSF
jgi:outer membrane receptor protein involved in Fe transport